jgi:Na+/H+ antiporter NhaD/arsenite permease-like protein
MSHDLLYVILAFVYAGMMLGEIPGLALDRTGVALLGAIALLGTGQLGRQAALDAVDVPTIALLFGLMVVSSQFRLGGFYSRVTERIAAVRVGPPALLALVVGTSGVLSALLANDIVCLAMTPLLIVGCARRGLDPRPFLLGLACAANVGSAATLIGNPQNMLIGQKLGLSFSGYLADAAMPSLLGLGVVWAVVRWHFKGRWERVTEVAPVPVQLFSSWQTGKGALVLVLLVGAFVATSWPREVLALVAAGVLLLSRRMTSRTMLGYVDFQLLVLFVSLFIVNHAVAHSGALDHLTERLRGLGVELTAPVDLFLSSAVLSNLVSNVPAVMLLLPSATHPLGGPVLALSSTFAGNLLVVGSLANIIVVDQARHLGVSITVREHARIGIPVTILTLLVAAAWLWLRAAILPG